MKMGRNIGDQNRAAREEREAGIGWEVLEEEGGARIIGAAGVRREFRGVVSFVVSGSDLWIPGSSAADVVAALQANDFGARIV